MDYIGMNITLTLTPLEAKALAQMVGVTEFFEGAGSPYETPDDRKLQAAACRAIRKLENARSTNDRR